MANMNIKLEELNALSDEIITKVDEWVKNHPNATAEEVIEASVRIGMACGLDHSDDIVQIDNPEEFQKEAEKALKDAGLKVKINTVALKGINDDELIYLLEFAREKDCQIRFIEFMENTHASDLAGLKSNEILDILRRKFIFTALPKSQSSPASLYALGDGYTFGIIDPHKHDFCESCNRIRLSAEGLLIPCLYFEDALSIKKAVKEGDIAAAAEILAKILANKPEKNRWEADEANEISSRAFYETGG